MKQEYLFKSLVLSTLVFSLISGWTQNASAISASTRDTIVNGALKATQFGLATPPTEVTTILGAYLAYYAEQKPITPVVGQVALSGISPVSELFPGTITYLTFHFIDPATQLITAGPAVGSVRYEVNTDPSMPNTFSSLGTSSNGASGFALPFTVGNNEPFFRATPLTPSGSAIVISGVDNLNVAIGTEANVNPIPEPSTIALFGTGLTVELLRRYQILAQR